ncbi:GNAT family N-acetyltransferase [Thauera aromatica]|uniref:Putative acetyltransferase n=2 Tax=Thauera aromatica TaxID=59405 RepID=A0A2R4BLN3_THAAR|nr:GNAT family N-acetyltransferase [Thauera aromatica]AVR88239.1 putative acetyltransferase [Thauera aromatica K172]MCK2097648.1 GNAT family N-acetyltransferase [Thauera aromatica]
MTSHPHPTTKQMIDQFSGEPNYSDPNPDDAVALSRDRIPVRSLTQEDFDAVVRIDRHDSGQDRSAYYRRKFEEALGGSGVRVSVVAEQDGAVVGFLMARVDFGEFGRAAAAAVIDTVGVDPAMKGRHIGKALVSQLLANLTTLRVESVRSEVEWNQFGLLHFLERCGFRPGQQLALSRPLN